MAELKTAHWTERSGDDFLYRIASDFVRQVERAMEESDISQAELAKNLGVTEGRVSQVINNPGNLTLRKVIEYARALGKKVSVVAYDDNDSENRNGPINAEVFAACWERLGKPTDFFELDKNQVTAGNVATVLEPPKVCSSGAQAIMYNLLGGRGVHDAVGISTSSEIGSSMTFSTEAQLTERNPATSRPDPGVDYVRT